MTNKFNPGDRIKIYPVGCYGGCTGTFVRYSTSAGCFCFVKLDELGGELEFSLNMVEAEWE